MYVDSVYVKHFQEVAQLISPMTTAPMSGCLAFYYQLQQGNDNIFSVYTRDGAGLYEEIWKTGSPGNAVWNLAEVEFSAPYPMEVGVPGVPGVPHLAALQGCQPHTGLEVRRLDSLTVVLSFLLCLDPSLSSPFLGPLHFSPFLCISFCLPPLSPSFSKKNIFSKDTYGKASPPARFLGHTVPLNLALWS